MTSGASEEPPIPASTMWLTPPACSEVAQREDLGNQRTRDGHRLRPAQPLDGFGCGIRPPEGLVAVGDAARDEVGDQLGNHPGDRVLWGARRLDVDRHFAASRAADTVSSNSFQETMNLSTPSFSSSWVTSS